jgi:hypothetical protein
MATQPGPINVSYGWPASGDLSSAQYKFVELTTGQLTVCNAAGDFALGVLTNKPAAAGRSGNVVIFGPTKVKCGGAVTAGDLVTTDNAGLAVTVNPIGGAGDVNKAILGRAMSTSSGTGEVISVWVNCINPGPAK